MASPARASVPPAGAPGAGEGGGTGAQPEPFKTPESCGATAAVSSVDAYASDVGLTVLQCGGNAVDAAVAMAAVLGVTEPFSSGVGGGGFLVYREAATGAVHTIDGRETAPAAYTETEFTDGAGNALDFDAVVGSGKSVGIPGTPATWEAALASFGTRDLWELLEPAEQLARNGFVVDQNYHDHTAQNAERFSRFPETARVFMPDGEPPAVGSEFRNPDLAETYRILRTQGVREFYEGALAQAVLAEANRPTTAGGDEVPGSPMTAQDMASYAALPGEPTVSAYRGMTVYGMGLPSSGGIAVGETLNLLQEIERRTGTPLSALSEVDYLHRFAESTAIAFADRNRWVGHVPDVPIGELLSTGFAGERAALFAPDRAQDRPIPFGSPDGDYEDAAAAGIGQPEPHEGQSTTHLNVVDQYGNAVSYTLTIEQTGGSGITVPGYGFLLNNELTDFNFVPVTPGVPDPNLPGPGKRPRSSMSPTLITDDAGLRLSVGTPGGATIITTVAMIIAGYFERGLPLVDAVAAPRLSSRNSFPEDADLGLGSSPTGAGLAALGHEIQDEDPGSWIGNASGVAREGAMLVAAAETERGGGGAARSW